MRLYLENESGLQGYFEKKKEISDLKLLTLISRDILMDPTRYEYINNIVKSQKFNGLINSDIVIAFDNDYNRATFSKEELENLQALEKDFAKNGITISVYDKEYIYSYDEVSIATRKLLRNVKSIKKCNYSPLEKLMHAYLIVTDRQAKHEDETIESPSLSRSIYGVLNSEKIVCAGFATYLSEIVNELGDDNLKCFRNIFCITKGHGKKISIVAHETDLVFIDDDKYNIHGYFHLDPTYDRIDLKYPAAGLAYFLIDVKNIPNIYGSRKVTDKDNAEALYMKLFGNNGEDIDPKWKNFVINSKWPDSLSISSNGANLHMKVRSKEIKSINHRESLGEHLAKRSDFQDFLALEETKKHCLRKKFNFHEDLINNHNLSVTNPQDLYSYKNKKIVNKFLCEHSQKVDMKEIIEAFCVARKNYSHVSKDENSKVLYDTLKRSRVWARYFMKECVDSDFAKCEEF